MLFRSDPELRVIAPACLDVTLRRRGSTVFVHLINRSSGIPNLSNNGAVDEIPHIGPVTVRMKSPVQPQQVSWRFEDGKPEHQWNNGVLTVRIPSVKIHGVLEVVRPA